MLTRRTAATHAYALNVFRQYDRAQIPLLVGIGARKSKGEPVSIIRQGQGRMPGFGGIFEGAAILAGFGTTDGDGRLRDFPPAGQLLVRGDYRLRSTPAPTSPRRDARRSFPQ